MDKICKFCGQAVRVNEENYDVFEGMHWLCFHLSFEHGDYDPDEPCDDPSCPWNRIGKSYFSDYENRSWDVKIVALNNHQLIEMKLADWETDRLPSVAIQIGLLGGAVGYKSKRVWYTFADVEQFITSLTIINERAVGKAALRGMSPNQFDIEVENIDSRGHFVLKYGIGFYEYIGDTRLESFINSGFEIDLQTIDRMAQGLDEMKSKIGLAKEVKNE